MDRSEKIGLGVATSGHVLLIALLSLGLFQSQAPRRLAPPAIDVSFADAVALEARVSDAGEPPAAQAPTLGASEPAAAAATPPPEPVKATPAPVPVPTPPARKVEAAPPPLAQPKPQAQTPAKPKPETRQPAKPAPAKPKPAPAAPAKTTPTTTAKPAAKAAEGPTRANAKPNPARASRLGDLIKGIDGAPPAKPTDSAAQGNAPVSAATARALNAEITRQIKPHWKAPTGADADKLVTVLAVELREDGSLAEAPRIVQQTGATASNASQRQLHAENAIRAVRLAAPFKLPPDLYDAWKSLEINFDKRLSQ